jgi:hypothetical protein
MRTAHSRPAAASEDGLLLKNNPEAIFAILLVSLVFRHKFSRDVLRVAYSVCGAFFTEHGTRTSQQVAKDL